MVEGLRDIKSLTSLQETMLGNLKWLGKWNTMYNQLIVQDGISTSLWQGVLECGKLPAGIERSGPPGITVFFWGAREEQLRSYIIIYSPDLRHILSAQKTCLKSGLKTNVLHATL